jgi:hypothetical protein
MIIEISHCSQQPKRRIILYYYIGRFYLSYEIYSDLVEISRVEISVGNVRSNSISGLWRAVVICIMIIIIIIIIIYYAEAVSGAEKFLTDEVCKLI